MIVSHTGDDVFQELVIEMRKTKHENIDISDGQSDEPGLNFGLSRAPAQESDQAQAGATDAEDEEEWNEPGEEVSDDG